MTVCEYCGEIEDKVIKCKQCGTKFCEYCGEPENQLCDECIDNDDDELSDEEEDWDDDEGKDSM